MTNTKGMDAMMIVKLPLLFFEDHEARYLPTPAVLRQDRRHVWIRRDDPAVADLIDDAHYYADAQGGPSEGGFLRRSAQATLRALGVSDR